MADTTKLMQLAAALKALHSERQLHTEDSPHSTIMATRRAARHTTIELHAAVDEVLAEVLAPMGKEA